jgi:hypothetical protein
MEKLTIKQQESIIKKVILAHFGGGMQYHKEVINNYFRNFDKYKLDEFNISLYPSNHEHFFIHGISLFNIENIILEIGMPSMDLKKYKETELFLKTIDNNQINLTFNTEEHPVETEQDCLDYCQSIIYYMETEGKNFVEKYSYLPNILKEMDSLVKAGKYWNGMYGKGGILTGGFDSNFRGLIISKLCNDSNHANKLDWIESRVVENEKWFPYYEKLKERLKSIEPIYNIQA